MQSSLQYLFISCTLTASECIKNYWVEGKCGMRESFKKEMFPL
jgi:hypothetical protein